MYQQNSKFNIIKKELYVSKIHSVSRSYLLRRFIKAGSPRYCDGFVYISEGECTYTFDDGTEFVAKKDQLLYLAKGALYDMNITSDRYSYTFINFDFITSEKMISAIYPLTNTAQAKFQFDRLLTTFEKKNEGWECDCASIFYCVYSSLISQNNTYASLKTRDIAYEAQNYFIENLFSPELCVSDAAKKLNISSSHLRRIFISVFGLSPIKFIRTARISRATSLMSVLGLSMVEVSEQCGFSSYQYFCRTFKDITGTTPANYRKSIE